MKMHSKKLVLLLLLCGLACSLFLVPTASALSTHAAQPHTTCSGTACNGTNPYDTGCTNGAYWVVDSVPVNSNGGNYGWVQLWYSSTCGTNWARYVCSSSCHFVGIGLWVCRGGGSAGNADHVVQSTSAYGTSFTKQEYLPFTPAAAEASWAVQNGTTGAMTGCF